MSSRRELEALAELARRRASDDPRQAAEALTAVVAMQDFASVESMIRIARLHERAGQLALARDWLDRARWVDARHPEVAQHLIRVAVAQGDPVGVEDAEAGDPVAAARGWCELGQPERALPLLGAASNDRADVRLAQAEAAAAARDEAGVVVGLNDALARARRHRAHAEAFLLAAALEGLGHASETVLAVTANARPSLRTTPARGLSAEDREELGVESVRPRPKVRGPRHVQVAASAVALLLGAELDPNLEEIRLSGSSAKARQRFAEALVVAPRAKDSLRVGLLAAVDPLEALKGEPKARQLDLAVMVLGPGLSERLAAVGLGLDFLAER